MGANALIFVIFNEIPNYGLVGGEYRISSCNYIAILKLQGVIRLDIYCGKHALPLQLPECDEVVVVAVNFIRTTRF